MAVYSRDIYRLARSRVAPIAREHGAVSRKNSRVPSYIRELGDGRCVLVEVRADPAGWIEPEGHQFTIESWTGPLGDPRLGALDNGGFARIGEVLSPWAKRQMTSYFEGYIHSSRSNDVLTFVSSFIDNEVNFDDLWIPVRTESHVRDSLDIVEPDLPRLFQSRP